MDEQKLQLIECTSCSGSC